MEDEGRFWGNTAPFYIRDHTSGIYVCLGALGPGERVILMSVLPGRVQQSQSPHGIVLKAALGLLVQWISGPADSCSVPPSSPPSLHTAAADLASSSPRLYHACEANIFPLPPSLFQNHVTPAPHLDSAILPVAGLLPCTSWSSSQREACRGVGSLCEHQEQGQGLAWLGLLLNEINSVRGEEQSA